MAQVEQVSDLTGHKDKMVSRLQTSLSVCLFSVAAALGQPAPDKLLMVEDVFKNVQVLKGIPVTEFMGTMGFFSASLGYNCTNCHTADSLGNWAKYADDI